MPTITVVLITWLSIFSVSDGKPVLQEEEDVEILDEMAGRNSSKMTEGIIYTDNVNGNKSEESIIFFAASADGDENGSDQGIPGKVNIEIGVLLFSTDNTMKIDSDADDANENEFKSKQNLLIERLFNNKDTKNRHHGKKGKQRYSS